MPKRKKSSKRKNKYLFLIVSLLLFAGICFGGYRVYNLFSNNTWDGKNQINLVIAGKSAVAVLCFSPAENNLKLITIPQGALLETAGGYGKYRAEALYLLDQIEEKKGRLLMASFQELFLIPIDSWVYTEAPISEASNLDLVLKHIKDALQYQKSSSLSPWDLWRLKWLLRKVNSNKVKMIDLEKLGVMKEIDLPDGTKSLEFDTQVVGDELRDLFVDPTIKQEGATISVINGSGVVGLATKGGKVIERMGGRLIKIGDYPEAEIEGCELWSLLKVEESYTLRRLMRIFGCIWKNKGLEGNRAEIILMLGKQN